MGNNETLMYYSDLSQEELQFLLYYNQIMLNHSASLELQEYYQQKINYISSLIKE